MHGTFRTGKGNQHFVHTFRPFTSHLGDGWDFLRNYAAQPAEMAEAVQATGSLESRVKV